MLKKNILLCVDLQTYLQHDQLLKSGQEYLGILRHDVPNEGNLFDDGILTFKEIGTSSSTVRRNVCTYNGEHITCTKRLNGTVRLNFKNLKVDAEFNVDGYALEVANEIREALKGFIEEE